jgi:glycosyltransferase involved in cell wall biosynthesis
MLDHWFEFAAEQKALWRGLARGLGRPAARRLYVAWQRRKAPATPVWQTQRRLLERAARVLPNSQSEADLLRAVFNLNGDFQAKVDVVPNGIDPALYDPAPAPSEQFLAQHGLRDFVLEVGAISPVKNQLGLIRALWDVPVPLVFIGKPAEAMPEYAEQCRALGAQRGKTLFLERMPHDELPGVYALARVHALPSWRETPGLVSLEAACAGCRIVTTTIGSTRDYFGEHAWYVYPDDLAGLRRAVEAALSAPPRPALRARILSEFTWAKAGDATLRAYQRTLA